VTKGEWPSRVCKTGIGLAIIQSCAHVVRPGYLKLNIWELLKQDFCSSAALPVIQTNDSCRKYVETYSRPMYF